LENDIPKLNELVKSESERREEGDEIVNNKITEEVSR
jgi:hypothetical protein